MSDSVKVTDKLYFGRLPPDVTEDLLHELCCQAGAVKQVNINTKADGHPAGFGFCQYETIEGAIYGYGLFKDALKLFGRSIIVDFSKADAQSVDDLPDGPKQLWHKVQAVFRHEGNHSRTQNKSPLGRIPQLSPAPAAPSLSPLPSTGGRGGGSPMTPIYHPGYGAYSSAAHYSTEGQSAPYGQTGTSYEKQQYGTSQGNTGYPSHPSGAPLHPAHPHPPASATSSHSRHHAPLHAFPLTTSTSSANPHPHPPTHNHHTSSTTTTKYPAATSHQQTTANAGLNNNNNNPSIATHQGWSAPDTGPQDNSHHPDNSQSQAGQSTRYQKASIQNYSYGHASPADSSELPNGHGPHQPYSAQQGQGVGHESQQNAAGQAHAHANNYPAFYVQDQAAHTDAPSSEYYGTEHYASGNGAGIADYNAPAQAGLESNSQTPYYMLHQVAAGAETSMQVYQSEYQQYDAQALHNSGSDPGMQTDQFQYSQVYMQAMSTDMPATVDASYGQAQLYNSGQDQQHDSQGHMWGNTNAASGLHYAGYQ